MHAHWLPGIDDGAESMRESLNMLRSYADLGYTSLIATPHIMADYYPNTPSEIHDRLIAVRKVALSEGISMELSAAAEYMLDDQFEAHIAKHGVLALPGNRILVEFGFMATPADLDGILFRLQTAAYLPVVAHPERYAYLHRKPNFWKQLIERGVELQVNLLSLTDHYGSKVQAAAINMIENGWVSMIGTDAHHTEHLVAAKKALQHRRIASLMEKYEFINHALRV